MLSEDSLRHILVMLGASSEMVSPVRRKLASSLLWSAKVDRSIYAKGK